MPRAVRSLFCQYRALTPPSAVQFNPAPSISHQKKRQSTSASATILSTIHGRHPPPPPKPPQPSGLSASQSYPPLKAIRLSRPSFASAVHRPCCPSPLPSFASAAPSVVEAIGLELILIDNVAKVPNLDDACAVAHVLGVDGLFDRAVASARLECPQLVFLCVQPRHPHLHATARNSTQQHARNSTHATTRTQAEGQKAEDGSARGDMPRKAERVTPGERVTPNRVVPPNRVVTPHRVVPPQ